MRVLVVLAVCCGLFTAWPCFGAPSTWRIDPDHAHVGFKVRHLMVAHVKGTFDKVSGVVDIDDQDLRKSKVSITIETASINTGIRKRDDHLRSADFFDAARFPVMSFVSKNVVVVGERKLKLMGDLTLRGVTREVVLEVEGPTAAITDPWGATRRGASATARVNRKDFGLVWNKALEAGGVAVGDDVDITIEVELVKE